MSKDATFMDFINPATVRVSKEKAQERLDVCASCDLFDKTLMRCTVCGCFMKLKATLEISRCPNDKW